jgi:hypothetical protein
MVKKLFILMFAFLFLTSLVSATQLTLVKVSDLKVGDVIVSNAGVEIPVSSLISIESNKLTISDYISQKVFGKNDDVKVQTQTTVASGNSGPGIMNGNAIVNIPVEKTVKLNNFQKIVNTLRGWFGLQ